MQNHLNEKMSVDFHLNKLVSKTHFHMKGRAPGLVLKHTKVKGTWKWPIDVFLDPCMPRV